MSDPRPMHFNADIIVIRISGGHPGQALAITKTDFNEQRRIAPEHLSKIIIRFRIQAISGPMNIQSR